MREFDLRMQLSPHFQLQEFTKSTTANKHGLYNIPREECEIANLKALASKVLEPARKLFNKPILITSGFRCATLNRLIGGAAQSQHMYGEAADFIVRGLPVFDAALALSVQDNLPFDQLIYEVKTRGGKPIEWIHISHTRNGENRREVLTIAPNSGRIKTRHGLHEYKELLPEPASL